MRIAFIVAFAWLSLIAPARAEPVADFYAHHSLNLLVGFPAGAAYDIYARLLARHLGDHVPGQPSVVVTNMPGASSLVLTNFLANAAPKDGSVVGAVIERVGLEPLIDPANARFDGRAFGWIGSLLKVTEVCMFWGAAPAKTIEDAKREEVIVGASGSSGGSALAARVLNAFVGTKFKIIGGYGGPELFLAMERGETEGRCGMSWGGLKAARPDWLADGKLNIVVQMAMQKDPELAGVPLITDLVQSNSDKDALRYLYATGEMGRPFVAPPGVPDDRIAALRAAFDATVADPAFIADAKRANLEISAVPGTRVQEIVQKLYETPRSIIDRVEALEMGP
jgi:tripartite-type tricarboxylate transporter receptor subunit TctC